MKNRLLSGLLIISMLLSFIPNFSAYASNETSETELYAIASAYGQVFAFEYADYDGNGMSEAFAVIVDENEMIEQTLFISSDGKVSIMDDSLIWYAYPSESRRVFFCEGKGFFWCDMGGHGPGMQTLLYSVKNNQPYALDLSGEIRGFYQEGDLFYTTENKLRPEGGRDYKLFALIYDSATQQFAKGKEISLTNSDVFDILPSQFIFSSGAGGWSTILNLNNDGSFEGQYYGQSVGFGEVYFCNFNGQFSEPAKVSEYCFIVKLESLNYNDSKGMAFERNGVKYYYSTPYGLTGTEEFMIYLPGAPRNELPEEFLSWAGAHCKIEDRMPSDTFGIYNVDEKEAFIGKPEYNVSFKEIPFASPFERDKDIYTEYLLKNPDLIGESFDSAMYDFDGDGTFELFTRSYTEDRGYISGYYIDYRFYTIQDGKVKVLLSEQNGFGTALRGNMSLGIDSQSKTPVIMITQIELNGIEYVSSDTIVGKLVDGKIVQDAEMSQVQILSFTDNSYYKSLIDTVRRETNLFTDDGDEFSYYQIDGRYVSQSEYSSRYTEPKDANLLLKAGNKNNPIPYTYEIQSFDSHSFDVYFVDHYSNAIDEMHLYDSVADDIIRNSSSFKIEWNKYLQAFCNKNYIDPFKLKNHPEFYYETVLLEAISQMQLDDDYLSRLEKETLDLTVSALDLFVTYDSSFTKRKDLFDTKLSDAKEAFGINSPAYKSFECAFNKYSDANTFYEDVKFIYEQCDKAETSFGEFLEAFSQYQVTRKASKEVVMALKYLHVRLATSSNAEDQHIYRAITNIEAYLNSNAERWLSEQLMKNIKEQMFGMLIALCEAVFEPFEIAMDIVEFGENAVFTISDVLFPTTMSSENYCKIYADYAIECTLKNSLISARLTYLDGDTGVEVIVGIFDLLGSVYEHEAKVAEVLAEQLYKDGLLNQLRGLFKDHNEQYSYELECIRSYRAALVQITSKKAEAYQQYGIDIGEYQPVILVYYLNGKVIGYEETAAPTGKTYTPPTGACPTPLSGITVEIGTYYSDQTFSVPYNDSIPITAPLVLFCTTKVTDNSTGEKILIDHSTGISATQGTASTATTLCTIIEDSGTSYISATRALGNQEFSLYDITLQCNGIEVQPTQPTTVRIPIMDNDPQKQGKVYRVANNKYTDMNSWIDDDNYCFVTDHFSEYIVVVGQIPKDLIQCDGGNTCPSKQFPDAPKVGNWAHEGIDFCIENELMNGVGNGLFNPNGTVTRAQLVTILYRIAGQPETTTKNSFNDVPMGQWYSDAIEWAADNGIVNGTGAGKFNPTGNITREQIATILYRYSGSAGTDRSLADFPDSNTVSGFAVTAMTWATEKGFINGVSTNGVTSLAPKNFATRAQIAAVIMRFISAQQEVDVQGHTYEFVLGTYSWTEAQTIALLDGGHLVTFDTQAEYEYVLSEITRNQLNEVYFIIGGNRDLNSTEYYWVDANDQKYGKPLNSQESWCADYWLKDEPTFVWNEINECYMQLYYAEKYNRWVLNDVQKKTTTPTNPTQRGFIIEYE